MSALKKIINSYSKTNLILVALLIVVTLIVYIASNSSGASERQALSEAKLAAKSVDEMMLQTENIFDSYADILSHYLDFENPDSTKFHKFTETIEHIYINSSDIATGYFYKINLNGDIAQAYNKTKLNSSDISFLFSNTSEYAELEQQLLNNKGWFLLNANEENYYIYSKPISINGQNIGFFGFAADLGYLEKSINTNSTDYNYSIMLSKDLRLIADPYQQIGGAMEDNFAPLLESIKANESGYKTISIDGKHWIYAYSALSSGQIYISVTQREHSMALQNFLLIFMIFFSALCIWLVQKNKKENLTPFEKIANKLMSHYLKDLSTTAEVSTKSGIAINFAIIGVLIMMGSFVLITRPFDIVLIAYISTFIFAAFALIAYVKGQMKPKRIYITACAALVLPIALHLLEGGFSGSEPGVALTWMPISVILVLFLIGEKRARQWYLCFVILIFIDLFIEMNFLSNPSIGQVYTSLVSLLFICFALFASLELYVTRSNENYTKVENLYTQLRDAQSQIVQREKMVTLGQLIAGIAHEINTPIGAVKASADTLASTRESVIRSIIEYGKDLEGEDLDFFFMLIEMSANGINDMKTTMEIRRAKKAIKAYFEEQGIDNATELSDILGRLEIINMDLIQQNLDFFKNEKALTILKMANSFFPYITATQTVLLATGKVTKIVFALKSYAHTNLSNEFGMFDIVSSVDNVLVLYHNSLKQNITVVKNYEDDIPKVYGNSDELGQVWTNIIQNAIYAMSEGGTLTISASQKENCVEIVLSDTGSGIPQQSLEKIFSPFFTTKPVGEGSGLGLDISKKIVEKHGGTIFVTSEVGQGTSFFITIPIEKTYIPIEKT